MVLHLAVFGFAAVSVTTASSDVASSETWTAEDWEALFEDGDSFCKPVIAQKMLDDPKHPDVCPGGYKDDGMLLCYEECPSGYHDDGALMCWEDCPDGWDMVAGVCWSSDWTVVPQESVGRGAGVIPNACGSGKSMESGLCYNTCRSGYTGFGCHCWKGLEAYGRGCGTAPNQCPSSHPNLQSGLCYQNCPSDFTIAEGPLCWKHCDKYNDGAKDTGFFCEWGSIKSQLPQAYFKSIVERQCSKGERSGVFCYESCPSGHTSVLGLCWNDNFGGALASVLATAATIPLLQGCFAAVAFMAPLMADYKTGEVPEGLDQLDFSPFLACAWIQMETLAAIDDKWERDGATVAITFANKVQAPLVGVNSYNGLAFDFADEDHVDIYGFQGGCVKAATTVEGSIGLDAGIGLFRDVHEIDSYKAFVSMGVEVLGTVSVGSAWEFDKTCSIGGITAESGIQAGLSSSHFHFVSPDFAVGACINFQRTLLSTIESPRSRAETIYAENFDLATTPPTDLVLRTDNYEAVVKHETTTTEEPTTSTTEVELTYTAIGPYADTSDRAMRHFMGYHTAEGCFAACSAYQYFALQNGDECFCDDDWSRVTMYGAADCGETGGGAFIDPNDNNYWGCGSTWDDANNKCGIRCPNGVDGDCPSGQTCFSHLVGCGSGFDSDHYGCGNGWTDANNKCGIHCPKGWKSECPSGEDCFADLHCNFVTSSSSSGSSHGWCNFVYKNERWTPVYFRGPSVMEQPAAEAYCQENGGHLATIHSETQLSAAAAECAGNCWIGLESEGGSLDWSWADGSALHFGFNSDGTPTTGISPWGEGEPNDVGLIEDCVVSVDIRSGRFNDARCDAEFYPLCETTTTIEEPTTTEDLMSWQLAINLNPCDGHDFGYYSGWWDSGESLGSDETAFTNDYVDSETMRVPVSYITIARHDGERCEMSKTWKLQDDSRSLHDYFADPDGRIYATGDGSVDDTHISADMPDSFAGETTDPIFGADGGLVLNWVYSNNGARIAVPGGYKIPYTLPGADENNDDLHGLGNEFGAKAYPGSSAWRHDAAMLSGDCHGGSCPMVGTDHGTALSDGECLGSYAIFVSQSPTEFVCQQQNAAAKRVDSHTAVQSQQTQHFGRAKDTGSHAMGTRPNGAEEAADSPKDTVIAVEVSEYGLEVFAFALMVLCTMSCVAWRVVKCSRQRSAYSKVGYVSDTEADTEENAAINDGDEQL